MQATSQSLLERAGVGGDPAAWGRLVSLYRPLVFRWVRGYALQDQDAEDLSQEVMAVLVRDLPTFSHTGRTGSFRCWLRLIVANRVRSFWRSGRLRPVATGDSNFQETLQQIEEPDSDLGRLWDRQHDEHVLAHILEGLESEFGPSTLAAFKRVAREGAKPDDVATELGISVAAVYIAKSRVLRRLRREAEGLIDGGSMDGPENRR